MPTLEQDTAPAELLAQVEGPIEGLLPFASGLWVLTPRQVHRLYGTALESWTLPGKADQLAIDTHGAVVCTDHALFWPLTGTSWPIQKPGPLCSIGLTTNTVVLDGGETSGHPTDRVNWRLVIDRATGVGSPLEITGQGGFTSTSRRLQLETSAGSAQLFGDTLHWKKRAWNLPGGITTLAADGDAVLAGTGTGAVYRLE